MIYGIRRDLQQKVVSDGHSLRIYGPFGTAWVRLFHASAFRTACEPVVRVTASHAAG